MSQPFPLATPSTSNSLSEFVCAYLIAAIFTDEPEGSGYTIGDLHPDFVDASYSDCTAFFRIFVIRMTPDEMCDFPWGQAGHDFWLTRNHHGAGFWEKDRNYPLHWFCTVERMCKLCEIFGETEAVFIQESEDE